MKAQPVPYIDIQHDALSVLDDVEQGIVAAEDIWVSAYKAGSSSVHGKARITAVDGGGSEIVSRAGIRLDRLSKTNFNVSVPGLQLQDIPVRFPRQIVHPPYRKQSAISAPLHINTIAHSPTKSQIAVGGPDGFLCVLPSGPEGRMEDGVVMKGHVGDVLDVKWFPSGEVLLSSSSDLSVRVFGAKDGINPRTLKGHTRTVMSLGIIGIGKEVVSASLDGTIRVWQVSTGKEIRKMEMEKRRGVQELILVTDPSGLMALGTNSDNTSEGEVVLLAATQGGMEIWRYTTGERVGRVEWGWESNLVSIDYSPTLGIIVTGHTDGTIAVRRIGDLSKVALFRRNEASVYSVKFDGGDLLVGTASGLPARLRVEVDSATALISSGNHGDSAEDTEGTQGTQQVEWDEKEAKGIRISVKEEYAGWEAVGVECWTTSKDGVWCAGGEGGVRRY